MSAERPRGVSRAGGRVSLACAAVGAIDRESERGEESDDGAEFEEEEEFW